MANNESADEQQDLYPEHTKLEKINDKSQACGEFIDWLYTKHGINICCADYEDGSGGEWRLVLTNTQYLLAEFFGIDLEKIDTEKAAMLEQLRNSGDSNDKM